MARAKNKEQPAPRKISETFLEFVAPLLEGLGPRATVDQMEHSLKLGFTTWNAVVYDAINANSRFVDQLRDLTGNDPAISAFLENLIDRKRRLFGNDLRLIGDYQLYRNNGELRLRAEARQPTPSL